MILYTMMSFKVLGYGIAGFTTSFMDVHCLEPDAVENNVVHKLCLYVCELWGLVSCQHIASRRC